MVGPDMDAKMDKRRFEVIGWLNDMFPNRNIPIGASEEELRARLLDGSILCGIIKKFDLGCSREIVSTDNRLEKIRTFIEVVEQMRLPSFKIEDLEQGTLSTVLYCLWSLKDHLVGDHEELSDMSSARDKWKPLESRLDILRGGNISSKQGSSLFGEERSHSFQESRLQRVLQSSILSESSTPRVHMGGHKFHEVFQLRPGNYYDLPAAKITEIMKSNSLDNAPTQSLLSVINGILDESIERKNGEIPHRVSCLLRKVVQEIERRISTQADHIRNQNNLIKTREEKYQSRIRVLETLANGTICEIQTEKQKVEERNNKHGEEDMVAKLTKQKEKSEQAISELKRELEITKKSYEQQLQKMEITKASREYHVELDKEKNEQTISPLKKELETMKRSYEQQLQQMETTNTKAAGEHHVELDKERNEQIISQLQKELETVKRTYKQQLEQIEIAKAAGQKQMELDKEKDEQTISQLKKELETKKRSFEQQLQQIEIGKATGQKHMEPDKEKNEQTISQLKKELETTKRSFEQQLQQIEIGKATGQKHVELDKEKNEQTISQLKKELETTKRSFEQQLQQIEIGKATGQKHVELDKEKNEQTISQLKKELETTKKSFEQQLQQIEIDKATGLKHAELDKEKNEQTISQLKKELETTKKSFEQQLQQIEIGKATGQKHAELDKEKNEQTISQLKKELETMKRSYQQQLEQMEIAKAAEQKHAELDMARLIEEKEKSERTISEIRQELQTVKKSHEQECRQMENKERERGAELEQKLKNAESSLAKSERRLLELKKNSETKFQIWNRKEQAFQNYIDIKFQLVKELRSSSHSIKHEVAITQKGWCDEIISFGRQLKVLTDAVENYHSVIAENRKLYNEVQELKGNIRVYCRIRPFLPGENQKHTIIDHIGDNGEVVVSNPSKSGKDGQKMFKFNKAYGQTTTQEQVYLDTQPLVRSVLDGFNVCIFAYGQTGSGKTYTMTGPDIASEKEWGVNYRALNDLFQISLKRKDTYTYEVGVQMVEIYNEQIRDLLTTGGSQKKLGVLITSQPSGLAVPDACMLPVKSTSDVMDVMQIGHSNRAVSATSLNERSSRSHSIVTIHVRGTDLKTGATSRGSLHLVDLAGSERVDRSEVTGDRLKEAQHINKSLAALGDVIFALSQKSTHVPYRNSKLTQVLQSSLGGQAKTLMFVQINPEIASFSESLSTLKFAERVSGVELGAAKSQKEGKDIRDWMEQVASLKDTIARKDEEIEQLQQIKGSISKHGNVSSLSHSSSSRISVLDGEDPNQKETLDGEVADQNSAEVELLGDDDGDSEERLSDISDGGLSMGTDQTDGSVGSSDNLLLEQVKSSETNKEKMNKISSRVSKPLGLKAVQTTATSRTRLKETLKSPTAASIKKSTSQTTLSSPKPSRLQVKAPTK